jgi:hypothetical protein
MLSKQYIISLAMDSPWLTTVLKKKIDQKFWLNDMVDSHPSGDETLEIHVLFRNQLLNNPQGLSRHEVLVGGSKRDSKGKKIPITQTIAKRELEYLWEVFVAVYALGVSEHGQDDRWGCGNTNSPYTNLKDMDENSVTITLACWLPDFRYFNFLEKNGIDDAYKSKYDPRAFELADKYLEINSI